MLRPRLVLLLAIAVPLIGSLAIAGDGAGASPADSVARTTGIALGAAHSCALTDAGNVRCWGRNADGQLGGGSIEMRGTAVEVQGLDAPAVQVAAGNNFTCALASSGTAQCWGSNANSQLGAMTSERCEDFPCSQVPVDVTGLKDARSIASGFGHTCATTKDGSLTCWGLNLYGQLGDGTTVDRALPTEVSGLSESVTAVAPGDVQSCALLVDTTVRCWGNNLLGELGDGTLTTSFTPVTVCSAPSCAQPLANIAQLSSGDHHTCAVSNIGEVYCWGSNAHGQIGTATASECGAPCSYTPVLVNGLGGPVTAVSASTASTCALLLSGAVQCWGLQFDFNDVWTMPTSIDDWHSGVSAVAAAYQHACSIDSVGALSCFGSNGAGQLGDGTLIGRLEATRVWLLSGRGDADCDTSISSLDAVLVLQLVAGLVPQLPCPDAAAAKGREFSSTDALAVLQFSAGLLR